MTTECFLLLQEMLRKAWQESIHEAQLVSRRVLSGHWLELRQTCDAAMSSKSGEVLKINARGWLMDPSSRADSSLQEITVSVDLSLSEITSQLPSLLVLGVAWSSNLLTVHIQMIASVMSFVQCENNELASRTHS